MAIVSNPLILILKSTKIYNKIDDINQIEMLIIAQKYKSIIFQVINNNGNPKTSHENPNVPKLFFWVF